MSWQQEFHVRVTRPMRLRLYGKNDDDDSCALLDGRFLYTSRDLTRELEKQPYWYFYICHPRKGAFCELSKHYYHQDLQPFARQWIRERIIASFLHVLMINDIIDLISDFVIL